MKNCITRRVVISVALLTAAISPVFAQTNLASNTAANSTAATAKTERFPQQIQVQGAKLKLNGFGTRYKVVFKVYEMGLYTTAKVKSAQDLDNVAGPVRMNFVALRDLPTADLAILLLRGVRDNSSPELYTRLAPATTRFLEIVSARPKISAGETFAIEYVPNIGVTFYIADKAQTTPMGNAEFFGMINRIWLGPIPADYKLKEALLGVAG